ncbi:MAG: hypothetical protein NT154_39820, partial [Verrucomicrobia bacterium]|nr:hypothetical protein [Verrucomicrobiota bacterium]
AAAAGSYELDGEMKLRRVDDAKAESAIRASVAIKTNVLTQDAASVICVDDDGNRWRLPQGELGVERVDREVVTERDLFNCAGTFYELPSNISGGFARIRPIATHNRRIQDYCSYRGLLMMSGVAGDGSHILRSEDGKVALWVGALDDLWQFGKPRGKGGPWKDSAVKADVPSDPYLMTGFDRKSLTLSADKNVSVRVEVDITGTGLWWTWRTFEVTRDRPTEYRFPAAFNACWVRTVADRDCSATAQLTYD